jgi:hypothetical protein
MELAVNAPIYCTDGRFGHAVGLVVYPAAKRVTHVIAEEQGFARIEYLVPLELIVEGSAAGLRLGRTRRAVAEMKPFVESAYLLAGSASWPDGASEWPGPFGALPGTLLDPNGIYEDIPLGELEIHRYTRVEARDGHVGGVDAFEVEPTSGRITQLVMREGHLWGRKEVTIQAAAIDRINDETIRLNLDKAAIAALPAVPTRRH